MLAYMIQFRINADREANEIWLGRKYACLEVRELVYLSRQANKFLVATVSWLF